MTAKTAAKAPLKAPLTPPKPKAITPEQHAADIQKYQRYVNVVTGQRNKAMSELAGMEADLMEAREIIAAQQSELEKLRKELAALKPEAPPQEPKEPQPKEDDAQ